MSIKSAVTTIFTFLYYLLLLIYRLNYIISCIDDCSRKVASKWAERKRSVVDVLNVLKEWIVDNGKPDKAIDDNNGKQFTSKITQLIHTMNVFF